MCTASAAAGHLTVPAELLANIPASQDMPGPPYDQLHLASVSAAPRGALAAPGMDSAVAPAIYAVGRFVQFR
jgi:hypothetical protein